MICVAATRPAAVMHARYLCKRLRVRFPAVKLVAGLWDSPGDLNKAQDRIGCGATVVSTLADAQKEILLMNTSHVSQLRSAVTIVNVCHNVTLQFQDQFACRTAWRICCMVLRRIKVLKDRLQPPSRLGADCSSSAAGWTR